MNALQHAKAEITQLYKLRSQQQRIIDVLRDALVETQRESNYRKNILLDIALDDSNPDAQLLACMALRRYPG